MPRPELAPPQAARFDVLGVPVSAIDMQDALEAIFGWIARREPHYVCVTGVHGIMESRRDARLRRIHEEAGLVTPDGVPLVWIARRRGLSHVRRVYGPDLMRACCAASLARGYRHFFYGATASVTERLATRLGRDFPGLRVAGRFSPPFRALTAAEDADVARRISDSGADVVWVGLSTPKQERWMAEHVGRVAAPVLVGVGAAFDFLSGEKRQAPRWMQRNGLEWCFRLTVEPRRLGKRYLVNNPLFLWELLRRGAPRGVSALASGARDAR